MSTTDAVLYKVLDADGRSFHGGDVAYSLPTRNDAGERTPGDWHEVAGPVELCSNGLHLTSEPVAWWADGARCFVAEHDGERIGDGQDKVAVRRCRLLRELIGEELHPVRVFTSGSHVVHSGSVQAYGSATVQAYDSATVGAYGSATVRASGSATVGAYDSATVSTTQWGQPTISVAGYAVWIDRKNGVPVIHAVTGAQFREVAGPTPESEDR